jgi:predicted flavoprotein YhiN
LRIALRPGVSAAELQTALGTPRGKQSLSNVLRKTLKLSPVGIGLLHESALASQEKLTTMTAPALAERINAVAIGLVAPQPIATAISTAGGVALDELDDRYMLRGRPGVFAAGEMLDWEAPTGGYLLQACFATGVAAARGALEWRAANAGP